MNIFVNLVNVYRLPTICGQILGTTDKTDDGIYSLLSLNIPNEDIQ